MSREAPSWAQTLGRMAALVCARRPGPPATGTQATSTMTAGCGGWLSVLVRRAELVARGGQDCVRHVQDSEWTYLRDKAKPAALGSPHARQTRTRGRVA